MDWDEFKSKRLGDQEFRESIEELYGNDPAALAEMRQYLDNIDKGLIPKPNYSEFGFVTKEGLKHPNEHWKHKEQVDDDDDDSDDHDRKLWDTSSWDPLGLLSKFWNYEKKSKNTSEDDGYIDSRKSRRSRESSGYDQYDEYNDGYYRQEKKKRRKRRRSKAPEANDGSEIEEMFYREKFKFMTEDDYAQFKKLEKYVDWSAYATPIKDQNTCAACYSFSAVGTYEVLYAMNNNQKYEFSVQEILDCSKENQGCKGGYPYKVYDYINRNGLTTLQGYPFFETQGFCVKSSEQFRIKKPFRYYFLRESVFDLLKALQYGPVNVVHSVNRNFKNYVGGIFDDNDCNGDLNHSGVAVGYDLNAEIPYFIIKNAWGSNWGEDGYYRVAIGMLNRMNKGVCKMFTHSMNTAVYFD